jgi:hypothetical protein
MTEWQRTKSPIHIYGTTRMGLLSRLALRFIMPTEAAV